MTVHFKYTVSLLQPSSNSVELHRNYEYVIVSSVLVLAVTFFFGNKIHIQKMS